jgi:hypothetical protein
MRQALPGDRRTRKRHQLHQERKMSYAIYRYNPSWISGATTGLVIKDGMPISFKTKAEAERWLEAAKLTSIVPQTTFGVRQINEDVS